MPTSYYRDIPNNTNPVWYKDAGLRLNVIHCIGCCFCVFYLGYDQSLLTGLQAIPAWVKYFHAPAGNRLGLIAASLFLPSIPSAFVGDFLASRFGRRITIWFGSILIIIGAVVNGTATNTGMFIGGRIILGTGGGITKVAAPALLQEIAHPRLRPIMASIYYPFFYVGGVIAAWFTYAALRFDGNNSWRVPVLFQVVGPVIVIAITLTAPESPRWLVKQGRNDQALRILQRYHANGSENDPLVEHTYGEICAALEQEELAAKTRWIDFFKTSGNRRRLLVLCSLALATNWVGNGIISYYLTPVLKSVGLTAPIQITGINGGLQIWNLILAVTAGFNVERVGRRPLFLISITGMLLSYCFVTGLSAEFAKHHHKNVGIAVIPFLYLFYGFYDIAMTPLPYSYTAEILPYNLRTKGLAIFTAVQNAGNAFNQFANPVALAKIAWKYYIVYIVILACYLVFAYFMYPETKYRTIEEVSMIFDYGRTGSRDRNQPAKDLAAHRIPNGSDGGSGDHPERKIDADHVESV